MKLSQSDANKESIGGPIGTQQPPMHAAKKKPVLTMLIFGAISLSGYVALVSNEDLVMDKFTMGGWYTALPVGAALVFSFVHGAFSSDLLSVLGLAAKK